MLSFVIPAHNEEAVIGQTLDSIRAAAQAVGAEFELIVVDDASTDQTAQIARTGLATVVPVSLRKISAVRNAGARVARGEVLIFVDADTLVTASVLQAVLEALRKGAIGGGARVGLDEGVPVWGRALTGMLSWAFARKSLAAGCFLFARRTAFDVAGGFDEEYFCSEEVHLSRALKSQGGFIIVPEYVTTSGRKFRMLSAWQFVKQAATIFSGGHSSLKRRESLGMWYGGQRESSGGDRRRIPLSC